MEIAEIREVRIHIDEEPYHSPNPTTGAALYALGHVVAGLELYREVNGDREDEPIENGPETVHLKEDEHFHSGPPKVYTIIVNGRKKEVSTKTLSFDQVVALAFNPVPVRAERAVFRDLPERPAEEPRGHVDRGRNRPHQGWDDLRCLRNQ